MSVVELDGALGEGGGQILRSSLSLSAITGKPFVIRNIRARRSRPGLMRQHLTAVRAAAQLCSAKVRGDELGSQELEFNPVKLESGSYHAAVGTAGSACLVLQTVLPALFHADGQSTVVLEGGTHNPHAPPFDFLEQTLFPVLTQMGANFAWSLAEPGFYPAGGGRIELTISPCRLKPIALLERGSAVKLSARILLVNLPEVIAQRELEELERQLSIDPDRIEVDRREGGPGPGNAVMLYLDSERHRETCTGFGERSVPVQKVIGGLAKEARRYLSAEAPVGVHLADQLVVPFALAGAGDFATVGISAHTSTNIEITQRFLDVPIRVDKEKRGSTRVIFG
ncbi:MAG: RNA 3'-terminal phosphate cyclase [Myxococcota bacterium]